MVNEEEAACARRSERGREKQAAGEERSAIKREEEPGLIEPAASAAVPFASSDLTGAEPLFSAAERSGRSAAAAGLVSSRNAARLVVHTDTLSARGVAESAGAAGLIIITIVSGMRSSSYTSTERASRTHSPLPRSGESGTTAPVQRPTYDLSSARSTERNRLRATVEIHRRSRREEEEAYRRRPRRRREINR